MAIYNVGSLGGLNTKDCTADPSKILDGYTAGVGKEIIEGTMQNNGSVNNAISNGVLKEGYTSGGTIANLIASNIANGVDICGVIGTFTGGITGVGTVSATSSSKSVSLPSNWKVAMFRCYDKTTVVAVRGTQKMYILKDNSGSTSSMTTSDFGTYYQVVYMSGDGGYINATITSENKFVLDASHYSWAWGTATVHAVYFY